MKAKYIIAAALVAGFASSALAEGCGPKVTLGGSLDTQFGYRDQASAFKYSTPTSVNGAYINSTEQNQHAIVNNTKITVDVEGEADMGFKYGGKIKLNADTSKPASSSRESGEDHVNAEETMMFLEGMFGRMEAGSYHGATHAMQVGTNSFARATGGAGHGDASDWWNTKTGSLNANGGNTTDVAHTFIESAVLPTNDTSKHGVNSKNASKVTYYTPNFMGFMAGVSFTPDMDSHGTVSLANSQIKTKDNIAAASVGTQSWTYSNIWEGGLHYEGMLDQFGVKASLLTQHGSAKNHFANVNSLVNRYHSLSAWEFGANVTYMGFTVGGQYGDWNKTGLKSDVARPAKRSSYWTLGAGYEYGPMGISLTYFTSKYGFNHDNAAANAALAATDQIASNTLNVWSLGVDYKLAPGLMPYAEVSAFKFKDKTNQMNTAARRDHFSNNKGTVFLLGSKLQF